jgi:uncharacterized membrane protein YwaF
MNFFEKIVYALSATMERPTIFGTWHFVSLALAIALTAFMIWKFKDCSDKTLRRILFIFWVVIVLLEVYKQIVFSMHSDGVTAEWRYQWYAFPFQFCSSPLYILPIVAFARDGKFRDAAIVFLATFSVFAGTCVYVFPNDVFTSQLFICIQTMVHHGVQVFFGVYLAFRYRDKMNFKGLVRATGVFTTLAAIAMAINLGAHYLFPLIGIEDTLNMFYISPFENCTLPVLSMVDEALPYAPFLCVYIFGFMLCAGLVMLIMKGLVKITKYSK